MIESNCGDYFIIETDSKYELVAYNVNFRQLFWINSTKIYTKNIQNQIIGRYKVEFTCGDDLDIFDIKYIHTASNYTVILTFDGRVYYGIGGNHFVRSTDTFLTAKIQIYIDDMTKLDTNGNLYWSKLPSNIDTLMSKINGNYIVEDFNARRNILLTSDGTLVKYDVYYPNKSLIILTSPLIKQIITLTFIYCLIDVDGNIYDVDSEYTLDKRPYTLDVAKRYFFAKTDILELSKNQLSILTTDNENDHESTLLTDINALVKADSMQISDVKVNNYNETISIKMDDNRVYVYSRESILQLIIHDHHVDRRRFKNIKSAKFISQSIVD